MMCFVPHSTLIGYHTRKMVRTIPLMYFVIYWSRINKNYLTKEILVESTRITCSRSRASLTTRREDILTLLVVNMNVLTRKLNWWLRSHRPIGRIERRRPANTVEKWAIMRKHVGRKLMTDNIRWNSLNGMFQVYDWLFSRSTHLLSISKLLKHCMLTHWRRNR